jgi:ribonuclease HII
MKRAIEGLTCSWTTILVDGNQTIPHFDSSIQKTVVGGDGKSASIAAASILAKVTRDRYMVEMHQTYPDYFFAKNKGYGTKEHRSMLLKKGMSPIHRRTFCENILLQTTLNI